MKVTRRQKKSTNKYKKGTIVGVENLGFRNNHDKLQ